MKSGNVGNVLELRLLSLCRGWTFEENQDGGGERGAGALDGDCVFQKLIPEYSVPFYKGEIKILLAFLI